MKKKPGLKKRSLDTGYKLSVLNGKEDHVPETLYSNLFQVIKSPKHIWTANLKHPEQFDSVTFSGRFGSILWNGKIISFNEINGTFPLWSFIYPNSVVKEDVITWLNDADKQKVIIWSLNNELVSLAKTIGLEEEENKQKFYFICDGEERSENWTTRLGRPSSLTVAKKIWAQQLNQYIYWHSAVIARFRYFNGNLVLRMTPTIQLTSDGHKPVFGPKEGTVITRLTYNRFNDIYLNSILFWASRFSGGKETIELANGKVQISPKPLSCKIGVGILSDKPVRETKYDVGIEELEGE